jgi:hypothetical protein
LATASMADLLQVKGRLPIPVTAPARFEGIWRTVPETALAKVETAVEPGSIFISSVPF